MILLFSPVNNPEVGTSLNSWLRSCVELTGTKAMCKEGGCGSCVVMLTRSDPVTGTDDNIAINSVCTYESKSGNLGYRI